MKACLCLCILSASVTMIYGYVWWHCTAISIFRSFTESETWRPPGTMARRLRRFVAWQPYDQGAFWEAHENQQSCLMNEWTLFKHDCVICSFWPPSKALCGGRYRRSHHTGERWSNSFHCSRGAQCEGAMPRIFRGSQVHQQYRWMVNAFLHKFIPQWT